MRVLIDECLNWRLGRALTGHYSTSVQLMPKVLAIMASLRPGQVVRVGP